MRGVIVIGAGLTGLACALHLQRSGIAVRVLEASSSPGGIIATLEKSGFLMEAGPQCPRFARPLWDLVREVELEKEFVQASSRSQRFILKEGELHQAPLSLRRFLSTRLVGPASKFRVFAEVIPRSRPPADEESLAEFVRRKFDEDVLAYLVDPFISTIFAGDTEKIGIDSAFPFLARWEKQRGSALWGALRSRRSQTSSASPGISTAAGATRSAITDFLPRMGSFRAGLGALPKAIATRLGGSISFGSKAERIEPVVSDARSDTPTWLVRLSDGQEMLASAVVVAAPAYEADRMLQKTAPKIGALLAEVEYAPMAVVASGYDRSQVRNPLHGFGLMIPRSERLDTFFCVWNSSVLPGRAPKGKVLITSFAGGATNPAIGERDEETIAQTVEAEMAAILGIEGHPVERAVWKHLRALPQFNVGHARKVNSIREALVDFPGLYLAGNYLQGRSLGDCAENGLRTADQIKHQFPD
jgi:protoporphyrinogen/coproporphyrinogen III oxidase